MMPPEKLSAVRKLCISIIKRGGFAQCGIAYDLLHLGDPRVFIEYKKKHYRFTDPDWNIVIKQLRTLLENIENEKNQQN